MKKYGSKDIMRMHSIEEKSHGEFTTRMMYAFNMAEAITEPGKAMARGFAAQEVFGKRSPVAAIFFERAFDLGGEGVMPTASVNQWEDSEEGIEEEYSGIPQEELPFSRRDSKLIWGAGNIKRKTSHSDLFAMGKINVIKGTGPKVKLFEFPTGIIEVWESDPGKYRLTYTMNYEPKFAINEERNFKYDGKEVTWKMVDYIETIHIANLAPLYGKSIMFFNYN